MEAAEPFEEEPLELAREARFGIGEVGALDSNTRRDRRLMGSALS